MATHFEDAPSGNYLQGVGTIAINGTEATVTLINDKEGNRIFHDVSVKDVPPEIITSLVGLPAGEQFSVRMSGDGTELYSVRPNKASVVLQFEKFSAKKDELPQPKIQKGGPREYNGKKWFAKDKLVFTAVFKVVSKKFKGMEIPYVLDYTFKQFETTTDVVIPMGNKKCDQVIDFLHLCGWDENVDEIPWSDNVLPYLEKCLRSKQKQVLAAINNGWIDSLSPFDNDLVVA
jgi:hypothetical protein